MARFLVDFAKFLPPELNNSGNFTRKISSREESGLWNPLAIEQNLQTFLKLSQHKVGQEGHIVLPRQFGLEAQLGHHVGIAGGRGHQEQPTVVPGLVKALLGQLELGLLRGQLGQLLPLLLAPALLGQAVAALQVAQLYGQLELVLGV